MKPKPGERITAAWASKLQRTEDFAAPPDGARTSNGIVQAQAKLNGSDVQVFVKNIGEELPPYSLIGVEEPEEVGEGSIVMLQATKDTATLTVCIGAQTVPADGIFIPIWPGNTPMRVLAEEADIFKVGEECGRGTDSFKLSTSGTGFICLEAPTNESDYAYVISIGGGSGPIWGVNIGKLVGAGNPLTGVSIGIAALLKSKTGNFQIWRHITLGGPTGGTYTIGLEGDDVINYDEVELDHDATVSEVQAAIRTLAGGSTAVVTGSAASYKIQFVDIDETLTVYSYDSFTGGSTPKTQVRKQIGPDLEVSDKRKFFIRRDQGAPIPDGTLIQIDNIQGVPTVVWADCKSHSSLKNLAEEP